MSSFLSWYLQRKSDFFLGLTWPFRTYILELHTHTALFSLTYILIVNSIYWYLPKNEENIQ